MIRTFRNCTTSALLARALSLALVTMLAVGVVVLLPPASARADYSPTYSSYYLFNSALKVGPNGTYMIASSALPSSYMALSDVQGHYTARTGFSRVLVPSGGVDCGYTVGCVAFDVPSTTMDWWPACTTPAVATGYWAQTFVSLGSVYNNTGCSGLGTTTSPLFIVSMNTSSIPSSWYAYQHVTRHEIGHALALGEASGTGSSCSWDSSLGVYLPLMNNGPCPSPYYNDYLTDNEVSAIVSWNGWY